MEFCWVPCEPHPAEAENSPLYYFQPHQLWPVQTTSTSTEDAASAGGAVPAQLTWDAIVKDHLLEYLVMIIDNEQELTISTNCITNEHRPSKGVLSNLKPAWLIHLPQQLSTPQLIYRYSLAQLQRCIQMWGMIPKKWNYWKLHRRSKCQCYFLWNYKKMGFLKQATQRLFNSIMLIKHVFFSVSFLQFLSKI